MRRLGRSREQEWSSLPLRSSTEGHHSPGSSFRRQCGKVVCVIVFIATLVAVGVWVSGTWQTSDVATGKPGPDFGNRADGRLQGEDTQGVQELETRMEDGPMNKACFGGAYKPTTIVGSGHRWAICTQTLGKLPCNVVSLGWDNDRSFYEYVLQNQPECNVIAMHMSANKDMDWLKLQLNHHFQFHPMIVGPGSPGKDTFVDPDGNANTMRRERVGTALQRLGLNTLKYISLLKVDVEGRELSIVPHLVDQMVSGAVPTVCQLVVEWHDFQNHDAKTRQRHQLTRVMLDEAGFRLYHVNDGSIETYLHRTC